MPHLLRPSHHDPIVPYHGADGHDSLAVAFRRCELHHKRRHRRPLEQPEIPPRGREVWLHALQGVHEHALAREIDLGAVRRDDRPGDAAARPEEVFHATPGLGGVGAERGGAVLADGDARGETGEGQIDDVAVTWVHAAFDGVRGAVGAELHGAGVGEEILAVGGEGEVVDVVG